MLTCFFRIWTRHWDSSQPVWVSNKSVAIFWACQVKSSQSYCINSIKRKNKVWWWSVSSHDHLISQIYHARLQAKLNLWSNTISRINALILVTTYSTLLEMPQRLVKMLSLITKNRWSQLLIKNISFLFRDLLKDYPVVSGLQVWKRGHFASFQPGTEMTA